MPYRQINSIVIVSAVLMAVVADVASASDSVAKKDVKQMRGPLDGHAAWIGEIVDSLEPADGKRAELQDIIDAGHTAWRTWFEANHERVAAHTKAVQEARASGDKARLKEAMKNKKAFMHMAPSIFRHPKPVRNALPENLRAVFDARLNEQIKKVHQRPPRATN